MCFFFFFFLASLRHFVHNDNDVILYGHGNFKHPNSYNVCELFLQQVFIIIIIIIKFMMLDRLFRLLR